MQVGQLVSGLAQELKSPLQGVIGNTELMLATGGAVADSTAELREIQENAARAAGIVRNLLACTETSALKRRWQDINELASRAVRHLAQRARRGRRPCASRARRPPAADVRGRSPARESHRHAALPTGAPIDACAGSRPPSPSRRGATSDDRLVIELDDRTAAALEEIDEPSWSGDLVACRQIVLAHGGSLAGRPPGRRRLSISPGAAGDRRRPGSPLRHRPLTEISHGQRHRFHQRQPRALPRGAEGVPRHPEHQRAAASTPTT